MASVTLRELVRSDWPALRDIRLHALRTEPGVFFSRYADEAVQADEHWMALATGDEKHQLFGLFAGEELVGISRVSVDRNDPSGATAELGMSYIAPEYRGRGLAGQLYEARLAWVRARPQFVRVVVGHRPVYVDDLSAIGHKPKRARRGCRDRRRGTSTPAPAPPAGFRG